MQLSQDDKKTLQAHEESRNIMEEKIYRQSSNEYEERSGSPRMGMFTALSNKPSSIFSIFVSFSCDALIHFSSSVNIPIRGLPDLSSYSLDGKIHSRVYEEIRTIVEEREDNTEEYDIEWEDDSREDDDLEYADAWDKNDNGIPDYAEDDR